MARFTVMGFTEAELGFVLAALFVAVAGVEVVQSRANAAGETENASALKRSESIADSLRRENDSLRLLTSKLTPPCSERGEPSTSVARVLVFPGGRYALDGRTMPLDGVTSRLAAVIERSRRLGCKYNIEVAPGRTSLNAADYIQGAERLTTYFYLRRVR